MHSTAIGSRQSDRQHHRQTNSRHSRKATRQRRPTSTASVPDVYLGPLGNLFASSGTLMSAVGANSLPARLCCAACEVAPSTKPAQQQQQQQQQHQQPSKLP